jgi:cyclophilin family peptidyl-prolyl cis-trans isomerase
MDLLMKRPPAVGTIGALLVLIMLAASCSTTTIVPATVTQAAAVKLAFTTQPAGALARSALTTQPVVAAEDGNGNVATGYKGPPVVLAILPGTGSSGAKLYGGTTVNLANGVVKFQGLSIDMAGLGYRLLATCSGLTSATSDAFDVAPGAETPTPPTPSNISKQWNTPPPMQVDISKTYFATVDTSLGAFKIQFFASETPKTVNNFIFLSQQGFYDGVIFHRIIKTFMIQTGDPTGTGAGGPGYRFADELPAKHSYDPGVVAMANSGPNTNGSQFFICAGSDAANLNRSPNYTQFGKVVEGMDTVQTIASVPVGPGNPGENSRPVSPPAINKITVTSQ